MSRSEAYANGLEHGTQEAESLVRFSSHGATDFEAVLREDVATAEADAARAYALGRLRGFRLTLARWERGELTWTML
jgi:hypothetical protein